MKPALKPEEREKAKAIRKDHRGPIRFMAYAEGWVMCRRPRAMPFIMRESDWEAIPFADDEGAK